MPLLLDLLRHGRAVPRHPDGDTGRLLTPEGVAAIQELAAGLAGEPSRPDRVFTSPLERARETARLVVAGLGIAIPIETLEELEPEQEPEDLLLALEERGLRSGHALLVGHLPLMARLARQLTGAEHVFGPGTLLRLEFKDAACAGTAQTVFTRTGGRSYPPGHRP